MAEAEAAVRDAFRRQADACSRMGSPFTAALCQTMAERLDRTTAIGERVLTWPGDPGSAALALRLASALHALVLTGADAELAAAWPPQPADAERIFEAAHGAFLRHEAAILSTLRNPPQTNETARSALILPALLGIARETGFPLSLFEIGASAGLNLVPDRFAYRYGEARFGAADAAVQLAPALRGAVPDLAGVLEIVRRQGIDQAPVDVRDPAARLRLLSYVWPDQPERLARCRAAMALAQDAGVVVERADAADAVERLVAATETGVATVLFHTVMWQYLPAPTKARIETALRQAGSRRSASAPLAWLRFEGTGERGNPPAEITLTLWPDGRTRVLGEGDFHGRWLNWYAQPRVAA